MLYIGIIACIKHAMCPRPIVRKVYEDGTGTLYVRIMGRFVDLRRFKHNGCSYELHRDN